MANDFTALGDCHLDELQRSSSWAPFQTGPIEEDYFWSNNLAADLESQQIDLTSAAANAMGGNAPGSLGTDTDTDTEQRRSDGNVSIDMNGPTVLGDYASLVLFTNHPLIHYQNIENCDSIKQTTIQALAARLDLHYSYDALQGVVRLQKKTYGSSFKQGSEQLSSTNEPFMPFGSQLPAPSPQPNSGYLTGIQGNPSSDPIKISPSSLHDSIAMGFNSTPNSFNFGNIDNQEGLDSHFPTSPQYQVMSEDEDMRLTSSSSPWQSTLAVFSRTLKDIGACWRCRILRKRCDPEQPCKTCPKPGTLNSRWQIIGCRRGTLVDHTSRISLCPKAGSPAGNAFDGSSNVAQRMFNIPRDDLVEQCLQDASSRLESVFASGDDTYTKIKLEVLCTPMAIVTDMPLSLRRDVEGNVIHIAWGLIDVTSAKNIWPLKSVEHILGVIKAAVVYETEYGLSQAVPIAIECFKNCIEILRLHDGGHLTPELHNKCGACKCQVNAIQNLSFNIVSFTDELSKLVFRKDSRLHERRWWLSTFYSLWIQCHVRRIILMMSQSKIELGAEMKRACSDYLSLALDLFDAASASFDPLKTPWSLEEEPVNMDLRLVKYYLQAQKALLSEQWTRTADSSMNYLRQLYQDSNGTPATYIQGDLPVSGLVNMDVEGHGAFNARPPFFQRIHNMPEHSGSEFSVPMRARSSTKRRARSPLRDAGRNGSSSSILDSSRDIRNRGLSTATPICISASPMSSNYSFAYGTSNSTRWNESVDSLAEATELYGSSPPNPQGRPSYLSPSKAYAPSLHHKSSNESFIELPKTINKGRPTRNTSQTSISEGFLFCKCCPKKPKKFATVEELNAHEAEKIYQCNFCVKRFKTKNETERHENSIHVRRYAWTCSNIPIGDYKSIFQESINRPGVADTCGYCGEDFARSEGDVDCKLAGERDWAERFNHVREVHKLGECNTTKLFYRADHFRQHIKHSHAATSGRWTSVLENLCMIDLPPLEPSMLGDGV